MQITANKKTRALLLTILFITTATHAQTVQIMGVRSCGIWISDRTNEQFFGHASWLIGYLSGMAIYSGRDVIRGTDNQSIYLWVDNYCRVNPLKNLADASFTLFEELAKQKRL